MKPNYPDDGGLKKQVRPYSAVLKVADVLRRQFSIERIEPEERPGGFRIFRIPHLFYRADNTVLVGGHIRLFGDKPPKGWVIYSYGTATGGSDYGLERRWNFGLFCIHHFARGEKVMYAPGWGINWASLKFAKHYQGWQLTFQKADTYAVPAKRWKR